MILDKEDDTLVMRENSTQSTIAKLKGRNVFTVIKDDYHYNILKELDCIPLNDIGDNESDIVEEKAASNRLSAVSKVNFSKLTNEEKDERLKNLARLVKQLRKKLRKYEAKPQVKDEGHDGSCSRSNNKLMNDFLKANNSLHSYEHFTSQTSHKLLENMISLIVDKKMDFDSIYFKKITKQVKRCMRKSSISISTLEEPHSAESSVGGNTVSTSSSTSIKGTSMNPEYTLTQSSFPCLQQLQDYPLYQNTNLNQGSNNHNNQSQRQLQQQKNLGFNHNINDNNNYHNAQTNSFYSSNEFNIDYSQYFSCLNKLYNSTKAFEAIQQNRLNQQNQQNQLQYNSMYSSPLFKLPY